MCSIEGCDKKIFSLGLCSMHYTRVRRWGDPHRKDKPGRAVGFKGTPFERVMEKVEKLPGGCWQFVGATNEHGYGIVRITVEGKQRNTRAHIITWSEKNGPVPVGKELDHFRFPLSCIGPGCCNPRHVKPATHRENSLRSNSPPALNAKKKRCNRGHLLEGDNLRTRRGREGRECRKCEIFMRNQRKEGAAK